MKKDEERGWRESVPGETSERKDPPEFLIVWGGRDKGGDPEATLATGPGWCVHS